MLQLPPSPKGAGATEWPDEHGQGEEPHSLFWIRENDGKA